MIATEKIIRIKILAAPASHVTHVVCGMIISYVEHFTKSTYVYDQYVHCGACSDIVAGVPIERKNGMIWHRNKYDKTWNQLSRYYYL